MAKICRMSPHAIETFSFNSVVLKNALDLLLSGGELLPGPASLISGAIQKIVDQPGGVEAFTDFLNAIVPGVSAPTVVPATPATPAKT